MRSCAATYLLLHAMDYHGAESVVLIQKRRDKVSAKRFLRLLPRSEPELSRVVADRLLILPATSGFALVSQ